MDNIVVIILAAGSSNRLGQPKQLIKYEGRSFIRLSVENCLGAKLKRVLVVLGSQSNRLAKEINDLPVRKVVNKNWERGIGSSLSFGLKKATRFWPDATGILISLSDQPLVTSMHITELVQLFTDSKKAIVASGYNGSFGPPLIFDRKFVGELSQLSGDKGAKSVLQNYPDEITIVDFPQGSLDVDTIEDLDKLKKNHRDKG